MAPNTPIRGQDLVELVLLAALWGASFLFMRLGAADFGPAALLLLRLAGAAAVLLPVLVLRGQWPALRQHWRPIVTVGVITSLLPFAAFITAALVLSAGLSSILNATAPLWAALIGWVVFADKPDRSRSVGLALGFAGVLLLAWDQASFKAGHHGVSPAVGIALCLAATLLYGVGAHFARMKLAGIPPLAVATGSQAGSAVLALVPAVLWWPAQTPGPVAWASAAALAVACTALAYVLYFRLIAHVGAGNAITVTFLIPAFGIGWGVLFLDEALDAQVVAGCAIIVLGTALATGALKWPRRTHPAA
jgi:drug/metabolite transporter (DMT)-like permease